jgi:glutamate-1-semialdehyde aminotransferase
LWENTLSSVHEIAAGIVLYPSKFEVCLVVLQLDENMIKRMRKKVTENYISWCRFVRKKHNLR